MSFKYSGVLGAIRSNWWLRGRDVLFGGLQMTPTMTSRDGRITPDGGSSHRYQAQMHCDPRYDSLHCRLGEPQGIQALWREWCLLALPFTSLAKPNPKLTTLKPVQVPRCICKSERSIPCSYTLYCVGDELTRCGLSSTGQKMKGYSLPGSITDSGVYPSIGSCYTIEQMGTGS